MFRHVRFSLDGKLLAASVEGRLYMLDAFTGEVRATMQTGMPQGSNACEPAFSPDSKYLLSGAQCWRLPNRFMLSSYHIRVVDHTSLVCAMPKTKQVHAKMRGHPEYMSSMQQLSGCTCLTYTAGEGHFCIGRGHLVPCHALEALAHRLASSPMHSRQPLC